MKNGLIDKRFKSNVVFTYATQLIGVAVGFGTVTLITRSSGIGTYGMVATMAAISGLVTNLLTFRTNEAVVYFYTKADVEKDPGGRKLALAAGMTLDLAMGVIIFASILFLAPLIAETLLKRSDMAKGVSIFSGVVLANFLRGAPLGLLVARERFRFMNCLTVGEQLVKLMLLCGMLVLGKSISFLDVAWATLISAVCATVIVYVQPLRLLLGELRSSSILFSRLPEYLRFSLSTFVSSSLKAVSQNFDTLVLGFVTTPAVVGVYGIFKQFLGPMSYIAAPVTSQIYPRFVQAVTERRFDDICTTIASVNKRLRLVFVALIAVTLPALYVYFYWIGQDIKAQYYMAFVLMALSGFKLQQMWWSRPLSNATDPNISLIANVMASVVLLLTLYPFTILWDLPGLAAANLLNVLLLAFYWQRVLTGHENFAKVESC